MLFLVLVHLLLLPGPHAATAHELYAGGAGWALQFDGENDFAKLIDELPCPPVTLEFWAAPRTAENGLGERIMTFNRQGTILARYSTSGRNQFSLQYGGVSVWMASATISPGTREYVARIGDGSIFHIAISITDTTWTLYLNATVLNQGFISRDDVENMCEQPLTSLPWILGSRPLYSGGKLSFDDRSFGGLLDEVRWWSKALSQEEVERWMEAVPLGDEPDLYRRWAFDSLANRSRPIEERGILEGGGDSVRAPKWVPSPLPLVGDTVAIDVKTGEWGNAQVCAAVRPLISAPGATARATLPSRGTVGYLVPSRTSAMSVATFDLTLQETSQGQDISKFCAEVHFWPEVAGTEVLTFAVEVTLPLAQGSATAPVLSSSGRMELRVSKNTPPVAGRAKALELDGATTYASLGSWNLPDNETDSGMSFSIWVLARAVVEDSCLLSQHTPTGSNVLLFCFFNGGYYLHYRCSEYCSGDQWSSKSVSNTFPESGATLESGKTPEQVRQERGLPHVLTVTMRCHSRGNVNNEPASATLKMYLDGSLIGDKQVDLCWHPGHGLMPWEMGSEYDGRPGSTHLPNSEVVPSNFFHGVFDDLRFWDRELSPAEVRAVAQGQSVREENLIVHYTFDLDDPQVCRDRQLADRRVRCHQLNDVAGRTEPSGLWHWTNSIIGSNGFTTNSPFYQVRGSPVHKTMEANSCASVLLLGADADGDRLAFTLQSAQAQGVPLPLTGPQSNLSLSGEELRFCSGGPDRLDVVVDFDACDSGGLCASATSGLGRAIFHVLEEGPRLLAFQALPLESALRLVFSVPTSQPDVTDPEALAGVVEFANMPSSTVVRAGVWEENGQALRVVLIEEGSIDTEPAWLDELGRANVSNQEPMLGVASDIGAPANNISVHIHLEGSLRNAAETSYPSLAQAQLQQAVMCPAGSVLVFNGTSCTPCRPGYSARSSTDQQCLACEPGRHQPLHGQDSCLRCPIGSFASRSGAVHCMPCESVLPGSTTPYSGAEANTSCVCPPGSAWSKATASAAPACKECSTGLSCKGGRPQGWQGQGHAEADHEQHQLPLQEAGYSAGRPPYPGGKPPYLTRCSGKVSCPQDLEMGTCPPLAAGISCATCVAGAYHIGEECVSCDETSLLGSTLVAMLVLTLGLVAVWFAAAKAPGVFSVMRTTAVLNFSVTLGTFQVLGVLTSLQMDWPEPMPMLREFLSIFVVNVDILKLQCLFGVEDSAPLSYLGSLSVYPTLAVSASVILLIRRQVKKEHMRLSHFLNFQGMGLMAFFTTVAVVSITPLRCRSDNPDGSSTVESYPAVVCWQTGTHTLMVVISALAILLFVVGFAAILVWATVAYPTMVVREEGSYFLAAFRFLFGPFVPQRFYFGLMLGIRKLLIALAPLTFVNLPPAQLFLLNLLVVVSLGLQCGLWPWRTDLSNLLDALLSVLLSVMISAGFVFGDSPGGEDQRRVAEYILYSGLCIAFASVLGGFIYCVIRVLKKSKEFYIFLSHHKVGAGSLARWMKMLLKDVGQAHVFLDSDDLLHLDSLMNIVANETENVVVLLTRETLARPWCAMELAVAYKVGVRVVPVACNDYQGISDSFLEELPNLWSAEHKTVMLNSGVSMQDVKEAYLSIRSLSELRLDRLGADVEVHRGLVRQVLHRCSVDRPNGGLFGRLHGQSLSSRVTVPQALLKSPSTVFATFSARGSTSSGVGARTSINSKRKVLLLSDLGSEEPACTCRVLQHLLQEQLQEDVIITGTYSSRSRCVLVALTATALNNFALAEALAKSCADPEIREVAPLLLGDFFDFPDARYWRQLLAGKVFSHEAIQDRGLTAEAIAAGYKRLFNTLALRFTAHGSTTIQTAEVAAIVGRVEAATSRSTWGAGTAEAIKTLAQEDLELDEKDEVQEEEEAGEGEGAAEEEDSNNELFQEGEQGKESLGDGNKNKTQRRKAQI